VSTWEKCSDAFLIMFSLLDKTNALQNKISTIQQLTDETITEAWEHLQDYISAWPHHNMEEWFIIESFYHGLICTTREHIDATAGGSFHALCIGEAHKLIEKMASNQSWDDEHTPSRTARFTSLKRWTCSPPRLIFS
jgi:O-succinylbenzoate synthase